MSTNIHTFWINFKNHFLKQNKNNQIPTKSFLDHITPSKIEQKGSYFHLTLQAPSDLHKRWLQENKLFKHIEQYYKENCDQDISHVQLEIIPCLPLPSPSSRTISPYPIAKSPIFFNPDYTFKTFIVGKNNHIAYGASLAVTRYKKTDEKYNPLFIYSPSGLGKTHLLNSIGQRILKNKPKARVIYLSAERFLNEYIMALKNKQMEQFRNKFRKNCDFLLMDDIQIIAKGKEIQEEFFHTFNELYNKQIQVVVCCDQAPSCVPHLEERIRTRLEGGLIADISYPDKETRMAILQSKIERKGLFLSLQSLEQIATSCKRSIREMEGVLNKIKIMTELHEGHLSLKDIEQILKKIQKDLTIEEIQKIVAKHFNISIDHIKSHSRKKTIVRARQTAMYFIRNYMKKSLSDISVAFGKKDHTTVLNSLRKVEKLRTECRDFKRILENLHQEIHNNYS